MKRLQHGFALFEGLVIFGVLAIIGLGGWNIYRQHQKPGSTTVTRVSQTIAVAPSISSLTDLDNAGRTLDQTSLDDSSDLSQLDQDLAGF